MVLYDRISIPDAYIIEETEERIRPRHDFDGVAVPASPAFEYPEADKLPDEIEEFQSRVIIIDL